jgi:hypothetical protein
MSRFPKIVGAAGAACALAAVAVAAPQVAAAASATQKLVVRPVTAAHHAAAGFHVEHRHGDVIDCRYASASRVAVNRNIFECDPAAAYAVACWHAARPGWALCLRNPFRREIDRVRAPHFGARHVAAPNHAAPFGLVLDNGAKCTIRDGGAWGAPKQRPRWVGFYSCTRVGAVYAPLKMARTNGINESHASWTVWTSKGNRVHRHHVRKVVYVGTRK